MDRTNHEIDVEQLPIIKLSDREQLIVEHVAHLRNVTYNDIEGGQIHGSQTSLDAHLTGTRGEAALAKYFDGLNIYDLNVLLPFGDGGEDFSLRGATIDTKATATGLDIPDLLVPETPAPKADWFVLAHVLDEATVRMIGMASRETVTNHSIRRAPSNRRNYWVPPEDLILFTE